MRIGIIILVVLTSAPIECLVASTQPETIERVRAVLLVKSVAASRAEYESQLLENGLSKEDVGRIIYTFAENVTDCIMAEATRLADERGLDVYDVLTAGGKARPSLNPIYAIRNRQSNNPCITEAFENAGLTSG